jgi:type II secretory pathway component GspD/PulD (secretin)
MRKLVVTAVIGWLICGAVLADESQDPESTAHVDPLAEQVLREQDALGDQEDDVPRLAARIAALEARDVELFLRAMREKLWIHRQLDRAHWTDIHFEGVSLREFAKQLRLHSGVNVFLTPSVSGKRFESLRITAAFQDLPIPEMLDLITAPYELAWGVRGRVVVIMTVDEKQRAMRRAETTLLRSRLHETQVTLKLDGATLEDAVSLLSLQTGVEIRIDPRVAKEAVTDAHLTLHLEDLPLDAALDLLVPSFPGEGAWHADGDAVVFTTQEKKTR